MPPSAVIGGERDLAQELHQILVGLEARKPWPELPERIRRLRDGVGRALEAQREKDSEALAQLRQRLQELAARLDDVTETLSCSAERLPVAFQEARARLLPLYAPLAESLRALDVHVPALRPRNYARNAYHALSALGCLGLVVFVGDSGTIATIALCVAGAAWFMEGTRRLSPRWNRFLLWWFTHLSHPHEATRVNSATWFTTALALVALLHNPVINAAMLMVLGFGDPAAAIVGRRYGRTRLLHGRSLEGSLAFVVSAGTAAFIALSVLHPELALGQRAWVALASATAGAVAELLSRRVDDNFSVPLAAAAAAWLVLGA